MVRGSAKHRFTGDLSCTRAECEQRRLSLLHPTLHASRFTRIGDGGIGGRDHCAAFISTQPQRWHCGQKPLPSVVQPNCYQSSAVDGWKIATIVSGVLATVTALLLASVESYSLFDMMIVFAAFIQMPINIPSLLALVSLKTPNWSGWATVMVGCAVSLFMMFIFDVQWLSSSPLTPRESKDLSVVATLAVHLLVTGGFFLFTRVFYAKESPSIQQSRTALAIQLATPISDEEQSPINHKQGLYVGSITALAGMLLILAGVVLAGSSQSIFVAIGCIVLLFSLFLLQPTQHSKRAWQKQKLSK